MKRYITSDYNINYNEVDNETNDYTWRINTYIHNLKDKPVLWRMFKQRTWEPSKVVYKIVDVPDKKIDSLVESLKQMPLLKQKHATVTKVPYDNTAVVRIEWKDAADVNASTDPHEPAMTYS